VSVAPFCLPRSSTPPPFSSQHTGAVSSPEVDGLAFESRALFTRPQAFWRELFPQPEPHIFFVSSSESAVILGLFLATAPFFLRTAAGVALEAFFSLKDVEVPVVPREVFPEPSRTLLRAYSCDSGCPVKAS